MMRAPPAFVLVVRGDLRMDAATIGRFRSLDGFAEMMQGLLVDSSLSCFGRARYTFTGNALFALGYTMIAAVSRLTARK